MVDRDGDAVVREGIHGILVDGVPFRTAAADHDIAALDGVRIGTVTTRTLDEPNADEQPLWAAADRASGAFETIQPAQRHPHVRTLVYDANIPNSMGTISARVPDELEEELEAYLEDERLDRSTAIRRLLAEGLETWRQERALERLGAGEITFTKAAELAGCSVWEFARLVEDHDTAWVDSAHTEQDLEDL
jgi:predicted HTH domain antitoxin